MRELTEPVARPTPEPLPASIGSVQPGGGFCYRLELAWGQWRRWYLRRFRPRYVRRMAELQSIVSRVSHNFFHEVAEPWLKVHAG